MTDEIINEVEEIAAEELQRPPRHKPIKVADHELEEERERDRRRRRWERGDILDHIETLQPLLQQLEISDDALLIAAMIMEQNSKIDFYGDEILGWFEYWEKERNND